MKKLLLMSLIGSLALIACESTNNDDNNDDTGTTLIEETLNPDEGGTVQTEDGLVSIEIPADALTEEVTLTVETVNAGDLDHQADDAVGEVYHFDLDGGSNEFDGFVVVTLGYDPSEFDAPEANLAIQTMTDDQFSGWQNVETSVVNTELNTVTCLVNHFSYFTIVIGEGSTIVDYGEAAGGDPTGTWDYTAYDVEYDPTLVPSHIRFEVEGLADGDMHFSADNNYDFDATLTLDLDLLMYGVSVWDTTLVGSDTQTGTWATSGTELTMAIGSSTYPELEGSEAAYDYSVNGDTLLLFNVVPSPDPAYGETLGRLVTILTRVE